MTSARAYASLATLGEIPACNACTASQNVAIKLSYAIRPTSGTRVSASVARRSSGELGRIGAFDTRLLHFEQLAPPCAEHRIEARAPGRADGEHAERVWCLDRRGRLVAQQVHLREQYAMRLLRELERVRFDLATQLIVLRLPVHGVDRNQEGEEPRSLDVPQELQAESATFVRSLDDAGQVGDAERAIRRELNDAKVGTERGERIVADLGLRRGDDRQQRRFSRVGLADQTDVGDELELELERASLAIFTRLKLSRRSVGRGGEVRVALSAASAPSDDNAVAVLQHFAQELGRCEISNDGADRDRQNDVGAGPSAPVAAGPVVAGRRRPRVAIRVVEKGGQVAVADDDDIAAATAIATVGATEGHELLTAERHDPRAAITSFDVYDDAIDEHVISPARAPTACAPRLRVRRQGIRRGRRAHDRSRLVQLQH